MDTIFILEELLLQWIVHIKCIWPIFLFKTYCNFKGALASIYLGGTVIISEGHMQQSCIFKGKVFLWNKHLQSYLFLKIFSQFALLQRCCNVAIQRRSDVAI